MAAIVRSLSRLNLRCASRTTVVRCFADGQNIDKKTHTGQEWDKDDFRKARFINRDKLVVDRFAIDLIAEDPIVVVEGRHVWSNSSGALGHPKVYINLDKPEPGVCGYSGRKFIQKKYYDKAKHGPCIAYEEYLEQMKNFTKAY